ncbi:MAG: histidine kinase [Nocardiopsaceae bacterium]|nr:histidine kinase [Nocardiopsaceae bacterium]
MTQADGAGNAGDKSHPDVPAHVPWLRLTGTEAQTPPERPLRPRSVVIQVIAGVLAVVIGVAVAGAFASRRVAERQAVTDTAHTTDLIAQLVVQPAIRNGLITGNQAALAAIDRVVRRQVLSKSLVRVKLWNAAGRIVYSDEARLIGQKFPLGREELASLAHPAVHAEVSELQRPENRYERGRGKLLEVYRPVWTPSGQPLLFETYSPYQQVTQRTGELWRGFAGITISSLLILVALLLPILWRLLNRVTRAQTQREKLLQRAVDASEEERLRIAGTLHDGPVQELAATSFTVAGAAERAAGSGEPEMAEMLATAAGAVRASIQGLRSLLVDIYPPSLTTAGLVPALTDLTGVLATRNIATHLELAEDAVERLQPDQQQLVFRIARECLRNAARHASARNVEVRLFRQGRASVLEINDDGTGFDPAPVLGNPEDGHFGLRILTDVAASAGADLLLATAPGAGCRWKLEVPDP